MAWLVPLAGVALGQPLRWQGSGPADADSGGSVSVYNPDRGVVFVTDAHGESWEWDGEVWTLVGRGGPPRPLKSGAYDERRHVYVMAGYGSAWEFDPDPHTAWYEFDGSVWREFRAPLGPVPREGAGVCYDPGRGAVVMFGGTWRFRGTPSGYSILDDVWVLRDGVWSLAGRGGIRPAVAGPLAFDAARGTIFLGAVWDESLVPPDLWELDGAWSRRAVWVPGSSWTFRYDPWRGGVGMLGSTAAPMDTLWTWTGAGWVSEALTGGLPTNLAWGAFAYDPQRDVDVSYGMVERRPNLLDLAASGVRERRGDRWGVVIDRPPMGRAGAGMVYDEARGRLVLVGGFTGGNVPEPFFIPEGSTWTFDGRAWEEHAVAGPAQRTNFAMAYDSGRGEAVVFGGRPPTDDRTAYADTWAWDGSAWALRATAGPSARSRVAMSYDRARGAVVLFGGLLGSSCYGDTWEWDGASWARRSVTGPSPRARHTMVYDEARHVVVLFGGTSPAFEFLGDTWEYDGAAWTRCEGPGPAARAGHAMVYDPERRVTVMWGGVTGSANLLDTWEWDGVAWREVAGTGLPTPRLAQAAAYDPVRHAVRTFGGTFSGNGTLSFGGLLDDSWTFGADCPTPIIRAQPRGVVVGNRGATVLAVEVEGGGVVRYQWRGGQPRRMIEGATGSTLSLSGLSLADAGVYDCIVTSDGECFRRRIVSDPAEVTVCIADYDGDGVVDGFDYAAYIEGYESGALEADVNGDGFLDFFDHDAFVEQFEAGC